MLHRSPRWTHRAEAGASAADGAGSRHGIGFPRLFDFLLLMMTRGREKAYRRDLLDLAGAAPGQHLLDIGCGTGTQAIEAYPCLQPGGAVVGVDISANMLAAARRKARHSGRDIRFERADATALPMGNDQFDAVTMTTVLHMVPQSKRRLCLREAFRVLKPGGRLLLVDYAGAPDSRAGWIARRGPHRVFDLHSLRHPMAEAGFVQIDGGPLHWLSLHFLRGTKA